MAWEILQDLVRWQMGTVLPDEEKYDFCDEESVASGRGCAKYKECFRNGQFGRYGCYTQTNVCYQLRGENVRPDLKNHGMDRCNPYGILEKWTKVGTKQTTCGGCEQRDGCRDFRPSPCFGCILPTNQDPLNETVQREVGQESESLCPFSRIKGMNNPARFLQCYLTRPAFTEYQTQQLGLYLMAFVYARPGGELIYATKGWDTRIVLPNFRCRDSKEDLIWEPDKREQLVTHVFQYLREIQAEVYSSPPHFVRLLTSGGLSHIYAPDGEISTFLLGWRLRKVLGPDGTARLAKWLDGAPLRQAEPLDAIEAKLKERLEGTGLRDFVTEEHWKLLFQPDEPRTLNDELMAMGLVKRTGSPTRLPQSFLPSERLYRLVDWLCKQASRPEGLLPFPKSGEAIIQPWLDLRGFTSVPQKLTEMANSLSPPMNSSVFPIADLRWLCEFLLSVPESGLEFSTRARTPLLGQYLCRRDETSSRGWVVLPTRVRVGVNFEPIGKDTPEIVGYAILHIKDSDEYGRPLPWQQLKKKLREFQPIMEFLARTEDEILLERELRLNPRERLIARALRHIVGNLSQLVDIIPDSPGKDRFCNHLKFALTVAEKSDPDCFEKTMTIAQLVEDLRPITSGSLIRVKVTDKTGDYSNLRVKEVLGGVIAELILNAQKRNAESADLLIELVSNFLHVTVRNPLRAHHSPPFHLLNDPDRPEPEPTSGIGTYLAKFFIHRIGGKIGFTKEGNEFVANIQIPVK